MTPWQQHRAKWSNCKECDLCKTRKHVVLLRGDVPAQILFIGEAPGMSEDTIGLPFKGPAGQLQDQIIKSAFSEFTNPPTFAMTNLIACMPVSRDGKIEPTTTSIEACSDRLREIVEIVNPRLIVCVGALSEKWVPHVASLFIRDNKVSVVHIMHPGAMLPPKMNAIQRPLAMKRSIVAISDAIMMAFDIR